MRPFLFSLALGVLLNAASVASAGQFAPTPICQISRDAAKLIGKRVKVEGYIFNLGSHGFVLTGKRRDCNAVLGLWTANVDGTPMWRRAFENSLGPKLAVLIGIMKWQQPHFGGPGHVPALTIEHVQYLSQREADLKDF